MIQLMFLSSFTITYRFNVSNVEFDTLTRHQERGI